MRPSHAAGRASLFGRLRRAISRSPVGRGWRRSRDLELWSRALSFAALGFLTLMPLLIIVSSADPEHGRGFAQWLGEGLGVSTASRAEVEQLFTRPGQALRTTTAFGIAALVTITYGPVGTVLVIQSWLVGVGAVVFDGALVGRLVHEEIPRAAHALKRQG